MFWNYLKVAFRNIKKQKFYSFINIVGLSIGIACCIFILLFIRDELGFDKFHENFDKTYRILTELESEDGRDAIAPTAIPLAPALKADLPEIESLARFSVKSHYLVGAGDKFFYETLAYVDPDFLEIFSFPLLYGKNRNGLVEPYSIVISERMAEKYFGDEDPLGQVLNVQNAGDYLVTGVLRDIPKNSHLRFDFLASYSTINNKPRAQEWDHFSNDYTYLLLPDGMDPADLEEKFTAILRKHFPPERAGDYKLLLQPLKDIHFSSLPGDAARTSEKVYMYIYTAIGLFILLIACINFMNLSTARSSRRAKEIGLRKVVGARRAQIIRQFLSESVFTSLISLFLAVGIVELFMPRINSFIRKEIVFNPFGDFFLLGSLLGLFLVVGLVSGSYPALFLSSFRPVGILRKTVFIKGKKISFRTVTVVLQFSISILLFIGTMAVYSQLDFMRKKDLGFPADQILAFPLAGSPVAEKFESFRNAVLSNPSVVAATVSSGTPGSGSSISITFNPEGYDEDYEKNMQVIFTDFDFVRTYGLTLTSGRDFSRTNMTDASQAIILNETAVKELNWEFPLGKTLKGDDDLILSVVGVVKDIHYDSLHSRIYPTMIALFTSRQEYGSVRIRTENAADTLAFLEKTWKAYAPNNPFSCFFIDEEFETWYNFERRLGTIFTICALLAIFISCLGILGLASYSAERRTKEIGIRKVLGASVSGLAGLLSKEFLRLIALANIIAWPLSYFVMNKWLMSFPYRVNLGWWMFVLSALIALVLTLLTVSYQSVKAALSNPVDSLRYE